MAVATTRFSGRAFSVQEVTLIGEVVRDCSGLSRRELARTVCELLRWRRPNGRLKARECRQFLERLDADGALVLPDKRQGRAAPWRPGARRSRRAGATQAAAAVSSPPARRRKPGHPAQQRRTGTRPPRQEAAAKPVRRRSTRPQPGPEQAAGCDWRTPPSWRLTGSVRPMTGTAALRARHRPRTPSNPYREPPDRPRHAARTRAESLATRADVTALGMADGVNSNVTPECPRRLLVADTHLQQVTFDYGIWNRRAGRARTPPQAL